MKYEVRLQLPFGYQNCLQNGPTIWNAVLRLIYIAARIGLMFQLIMQNAILAPVYVSWYRLHNL